MNRLLLLASALMALTGCVSPQIVLTPSMPAPGVATPAGPPSDVRVEVRQDSASAASRFEEKGDKALVGRSESLGVHLSDFYLEEPPSRLVQRLLESNLKAWGHRIVPGGEQAELRAQVNRVAFNNRAVSALEFQADGVIDVALEVVRRDARPGYRQRYVAECTLRTATSVPNKENMDRVFDQCVADFHKRVSSDLGLRAALSAGP